MLSDLDPLWLLLLGWLLGILSPALVTRITDQYRKAELKKAVLTDLNELQFTLLALAYRVRVHLGTLTKKDIEWMAPIYEAYHGDSEDAALVANFRTLKALSDPQFDAGVRTKKTPEGRGLSLKKYSLPYVTSQVAALSLFPPKAHQSVLQVVSKLDPFNQEVDYLLAQQALTFGSLDVTNRDIIADNLARGLSGLANRAQSLVSTISTAAAQLK